MPAALMPHFVSGLKSRNPETKFKTAQELSSYVKSELRESTQEEINNFLDEFNHHIFEMVSSSDVNEKKGGILAIGRYLYVSVLSCSKEQVVAWWTLSGTKWHLNSLLFLGLTTSVTSVTVLSFCILEAWYCYNCYMYIVEIREMSTEVLNIISHILNLTTYVGTVPSSVQTKIQNFL